MSVRRWPLLAAMSTLALLAAPMTVLAPSQAAPTSAAEATGTWGPIHRFERNPVGQSLAVDAHDVTTVAWGSQQGWPERVKVARRTAAGRWLDPVRLGVGYDPVVVADLAGNLTVAWLRDRQGFTTGVWAARKPVGRPWTRPVHLSQDLAVPGYPDGESAYGATDLDAAAGPEGAVLVTWAWGSLERDVAFRIQSAHRPPRGRWGAMQAVTKGAEASHAHVTYAWNGTAWVAYERSAATGPTRIQVRSRSAAGAWRAPQRVGTGAIGDVNASRRGDVSVVYLGRGRVREATRPAGGGWQAPDPVTPADTTVRDWSVALNPRSAGLVAYLFRHDRVDVVRRGAGGGWTGPMTLDDPTIRVAGTFTAVGPRGDMFAGWHNNYGMWGRYRPAGQGWQPTTTAQPDTGQVDVLEAVLTQVAPGGDVVLLWAQEERPLRARVLSTH